MGANPAIETQCVSIIVSMMEFVSSSLGQTIRGNLDVTVPLDFMELFAHEVPSLSLSLSLSLSHFTKLITCTIKAPTKRITSSLHV